MGKHAFWMASFQCLAKSLGPCQPIFVFKEGQDNLSFCIKFLCLTPLILYGQSYWVPNWKCA